MDVWAQPLQRTSNGLHAYHKAVASLQVQKIAKACIINGQIFYMNWNNPLP